MRSPSTQSLLKYFGRYIDRRGALLIKKLVKAVDDPDELRGLISAHLPATYQYERQVHSDPYRSRMWRRTMVLHAINEILDGHGVEPLGPVAMSGPPYEYINFGDPYVTTLIYRKASDNLFIGSWGDIAEKHSSW